MDLAETALLSFETKKEAPSMYLRQPMEVKAHLDERLLLGEEYFAAVYAGFASWAVARDVLARNNQDSIMGDSELQIPPDQWDPCFLASLALTGGAMWEGIGSAEVRHEFWEWYLTSAVPSAFMAVCSINCAEALTEYIGDEGVTIEQGGRGFLRTATQQLRIFQGSFVNEVRGIFGGASNLEAIANVTASEGVAGLGPMDNEP